MDLGTVVGIVLILALLLGAMSMGVGVGAYIDIPSVLIVVGGSIGALMVSYKPTQMKSFTKIFMVAIKPTIEDEVELIKKLVDFATKARKDGILALESEVNSEPNEFLKKGLSMAIDGSEPDTIRELLEIDMEQTSERHKINGSIFSNWAALAGAMGMVGTLIGLVAMLLNMADPSAIGPSMAVALLTTMYGAIIGNVFGTPIAIILGIRNDEETLVKEMILSGIMSIQSGDAPRVLEAKLLAYLAPKDRVSQFD
ncbi:flagellar motor rotation protein A [Sulfurimonas gotlandica GD1]|jgi:chemotaxis protein MotA|uniref:Flagellar motor rotation protein A n=1 Tax=Sulfurimonas gotlandica (strain DSM 19862 / JCM 16533 / GD1) TaxID=929558 RepID=B6BJT0_SULGG|nr:MotA/TolQ/ExbB proton channel family protein [Sulfurimonas gotlandica]EDZ62574.1 MotA/TolQ/ExbB proton channel [Sulfurimonas gotlandica GD1]EHP31330.1 flagellar motor rotation protein A [Sulfurimonas gotlandica GD1]